MSSEREKMLAGEMYDALDPELVARARPCPRSLPGPERDARRRAGRAAASAARTVRPRRRHRVDATAVLLRLRLEHRARRARVLQFQLHRAGRLFRFGLAALRLFGPAVQIYTPLHPLNAASRRRHEYRQACRDRVRRLGRRRRHHPSRRSHRLACGHWRRQRGHRAIFPRACLPPETPVVSCASIEA